MSQKICFSQKNIADSTTEKRNTFFAFPLVFYTPETSLGFGGAGIYSYRQKNLLDSLLPSQVQFGLAYTLNKQVLIYLPYQLYFNQNKITLYGELGYYKYNYNFYGVGNNPPKDFVENYGVTYPRVRINLLKKVFPTIFGGIRYWGEDFVITSLDSSGILIKNTVVGSEGGFTSGIGPVFNFDTRDAYFWPTKGWFAEFGVLFFDSFLGSDFQFSKITLDITKYYLFKWRHVVAINSYTEVNKGNVPFNMMGLIGGTRRMRGYYEGRFRDKNLALLQAEYRADLFWKIGVVAFGGLAQVVDEINYFKLNEFKWNAGVGLRFKINEKDNLNVRFDAGFGKNTNGFYLTIREAF